MEAWTQEVRVTLGGGRCKKEFIRHCPNLRRRVCPDYVTERSIRDGKEGQRSRRQEALPRRAVGGVGRHRRDQRPQLGLRNRRLIGYDEG